MKEPGDWPTELCKVNVEVEGLQDCVFLPHCGVAFPKVERKVLLE